MRCPGCDFENKEDIPFCLACGAPLKGSSVAETNETPPSPKNVPLGKLVEIVPEKVFSRPPLPSSQKEAFSSKVSEPLEKPLRQPDVPYSRPRVVKDKTVDESPEEKVLLTLRQSLLYYFPRLALCFLGVYGAWVLWGSTDFAAAWIQSFLRYNNITITPSMGNFFNTFGLFILREVSVIIGVICFLTMLVMCLKYARQRVVLTNERVIIYKGAFHLQTFQCDYSRIKECRVSRSIAGFMLLYGTLTIIPSSNLVRTFRIKGIHQVKKVKDYIESHLPQ